MQPRIVKCKKEQAILLSGFNAIIIRLIGIQKEKHTDERLSLILQLRGSMFNFLLIRVEILQALGKLVL